MSEKNTESAINWFNNIPDEQLYKFLMFDIKDFYPSIKEKLLWKAIRFLVQSTAQQVALF